MMEAFVSAYRYNSTPDIQKNVYCSLGLDEEWFCSKPDPQFEILGNICGGSENIRCDFAYNRTVLDNLLDIYRGFGCEYDEMYITGNVLKTMSATRNKVLCRVDFSGLPMPFYIPWGIKFNDGCWSCNFKNSHIYTLNIFENCTIMESGEQGGIKFTEKWASEIYMSLDNRFMLIRFEDDYAVLWDIEKRKVVSEVDFTKIDITQFNESDEKISNMRNEIYPQLSYFKGCDFRGAVFHDNDYKEKLKFMGAVID